MQSAIKITNLSKIYRLGQIGTGTLQRDLERWFRMKILGKGDPFSKIYEVNYHGIADDAEFVYSLSNINLEIEQGSSLGIIGSNGAGKSTLLKIISRVTSPSSGRINVIGRVASLLEVGTGFHPELTGRENIYLNGAILGMRKKEITRKLDEIIDFSGVSKYIDTPVKRYSSGMYVRLAFAVAAHLDSEILIVDEVLAVGDAEFQKKCLGKMTEISAGEGRTVLFVSHNMSAVKSLCSHGVLLHKGNIRRAGTVSEVIDFYLNPPKEYRTIEIPDNIERYGTGEAVYRSFYITNRDNKVVNQLSYREPFTMHFEFEVKRIIDDLHQFVFWTQIADSQGTIITMTSSIDNGAEPLKAYIGFHKFSAEMNLCLLPGKYIVNIAISNMKRNIDNLTNVYGFEVSEISDDTSKSYPWGGYRPGFVVPESQWRFNN